MLKYTIIGIVVALLGYIIITLVQEIFSNYGLVVYLLIHFMKHFFGLLGTTAVLAVALFLSTDSAQAAACATP